MFVDFLQIFHGRRLVSANAKQTEQALETAEAALAESRRTHRVEVAALRTIQSHVFHFVATVY